jgi:glycosyltransferase involved in cell wall biosynthesis
MKENLLAKELKKADILLGIFNHSDKGGRVIPNKVFQGLALGKPVITMKSIAVNEVLEHKKNIYFVEPNSPKSLAEAILDLKTKSLLRKKISQNSIIWFRGNYDSKAIGKKLLQIISTSLPTSHPVFI